jgi:(acyl-carrier-protein) S-malonyltransferase
LDDLDQQGRLDRHQRRAFVDLLVGQVASPVRWDLDMDAFAAAGVTGLIELAPAGALVGLAKRALKGLPTVAVKTPTTSRRLTSCSTTCRIPTSPMEHA